MVGGAGNDAYYVDNTGDMVVENSNEGTDTVFSTAHLRLTENVEYLVLQGSAEPAGLRQQRRQRADRQCGQQPARRPRRR
jgi:hypothetical protein